MSDVRVSCASPDCTATVTISFDDSGGAPDGFVLGSERWRVAPAKSGGGRSVSFWCADHRAERYA